MRRDARSWIVGAVVGALVGVGCSGGTSTPDGGPGLDAGPPLIDAGATTTIAAAIAGSVMSPITVVGVVTALAGQPPMDYPTWYIEDPAGGPNSGVAVYCDPDKASCPASDPRAPALHTLIAISGSLSKYKGQWQLVPTAQVILQANATPPPIPTVTASDLSPTGNSQYRGVFVKYATKLTVDDVTPAVLLDTECGTAPPDGGQALAADGGPASCSCAPPAYSGFRANDGMGNEIYVEAPFFNTDHLQSSPECLTGSGVIPVTVGKTFSSIQGIVDVDLYGGVQYLAPDQDSDYVTP